MCVGFNSRSDLVSSWNFRQMHMIQGLVQTPTDFLAFNEHEIGKVWQSYMTVHGSLSYFNVFLHRHWSSSSFFPLYQPIFPILSHFLHLLHIHLLLLNFHLLFHNRWYVQRDTPSPCIALLYILSFISICLPHFKPSMGGNNTWYSHSQFPWWLHCYITWKHRETGSQLPRRSFIARIIHSNMNTWQCRFFFFTSRNTVFSRWSLFPQVRGEVIQTSWRCKVVKLQKRLLITVADTVRTPEEPFLALQNCFFLNVYIVQPAECRTAMSFKNQDRCVLNWEYHRSIAMCFRKANHSEAALRGRWSRCSTWVGEFLSLPHSDLKNMVKRGSRILTIDTIIKPMRVKWIFSATIHI